MVIQEVIRRILGRYLTAKRTAPRSVGFKFTIARERLAQFRHNHSARWIPSLSKRRLRVAVLVPIALQPEAP